MRGLDLLTPVAVAVIMGGPAWFGIRRLRRENTEQHDSNSSLLGHVSRQVDKIDTEVDGLHVWTAKHDEHHRHLETKD